MSELYQVMVSVIPAKAGIYRLRVISGKDPLIQGDEMWDDQMWDDQMWGAVSLRTGACRRCGNLDCFMFIRNDSEVNVDRSHSL